MAEKVGYNPSQVKTLIENIAEGYNSLRSDIIIGKWEELKNTMRTNWVGPDEQNFESEFIYRINSLTMSSTQLTCNAIAAMLFTQKSWEDFQRKNILSPDNASEGNQTERVGDFGTIYDSSNFVGFAKDTELPTISGISNFTVNFDSLTSESDAVNGMPMSTITGFVAPLEFEPKEFDANTDYGLVTENSAETIQGMVSTYVEAVRSACENLFGSVDTSSAFFGTQHESIKNYIKAVSDAIVVVQTSVKDLNEALKNSASANYSGEGVSMSSTITTSMTEGQSKLNESLTEGLSNTRWDSN